MNAWFPALLAFALVICLPSAAFAQPGVGDSTPIALAHWPTLMLDGPSYEPWGMDVDDFGNVYVAGFALEAIHKYGPEGELLAEYLFPQASGYDPRDVAVDSAGNMWVADYSDRLIKLDPSGQILDEWTEWDLGGFPPVVYSVYQPEGVAVGPNDEIYLVVTPGNRLYQLDSDGEFVRAWGAPGSGPGQFSSPKAATVDPFGNVFVSDTGNHRIQKFDSKGNFLLEWNTVGPVSLREPLDISTDMRGNVHVIHDNGSQIVVSSGFGVYISHNLGGGPFDRAYGVAVFGSGSIFISDRSSGYRSIHKMGYPPTISAVEDVPDDQGRWARLTWTRSWLDRQETATAITGYGIYRRQPLGVAKAGSVERPALSARATAGDARTREFLARANKLEGWDALAMIPARRDSVYEAVVPTLCDSTATGGICWSVFMVSALTGELAFFDSVSDSGYSVDNIPPPVPAAPMVVENPGLLELAVSWLPSAAPDFAHFGVYRSDTPGEFPPSPDDTYAVTTAPSYVDTSVQSGETWYYRIAAFDDAGMFSGYSDDAGAQVLTAADSPAAGRRSLAQNVPNPFNPSTVISFTLPTASTARLDVFDISGRHIATLHDGEAPAGETSIRWNGADDEGSSVASGIYVYQLKTEGFLHARRMVLLR